MTRDRGMNNQISIEQLSNEIKRIYKSDRLHAETLIETYLEEKLKKFSDSKKLTLLERLADEFNAAISNRYRDSSIDKEVLARLFSLMLGRRISQADLSSTELLQKLAESLNTIFDALNQVVGVINTAFLGKSIGDETIRQVIGFYLEGGESHARSLSSYLGQIEKAFLIAHQAFKEAAHTEIGEILNELDPEQIKTAGSGGFKFGPFQKAELFEVYEKKFYTCKKWFDSGRFMEKFLREFEKNSQKLFVL
ncbi:MAG: hypothetical protein HF982_08730 [Desulfobacteraceae bacterium]|nr:hypothetical protein [Desulfobacteraceae bacterium]MBC2719654.1 hypothetical protein [Desulfobacteraceae bacterium]